MIESSIRKAESGADLTMDEMSAAIGRIMEGAVGEEQIARLLVALHKKGEAVAEIAGAAVAMRRHMTPIRSNRPDLLDTCGTGGDGARTFNISTAVALVTAASGAAVAKHGSRAATSRSGSAEVLTALGVNIEASVACVEACLEELGICFCFAPLLHVAMRHVAPVRKRLPHPTIFNFLGPLANPAGAPFQLLGVGRARMAPLMAESLQLLGARRALVVHGSDGLDEVTLGGATEGIEIAGRTRRDFRWTPADFGLPSATIEQMSIEGPAQSAEIILGILDGRHGPPRDIVLANTAAALWTVGRADTIATGMMIASAAVDSGAARELLGKLAARTHAG